jgi:hypothetical protein
MANNCLVTKLKSSVPGNMDYLENLSFEVKAVTSPEAKNFGLYVGSSVQQNITIEGDGFFTDNTMETNLGKTARTGNNLKYSNGNYIVKLPLTGISALTVGSSDIPIMTDWTMDGLNYERLCSLNKDTLLKICYNNYQSLLDTIQYTKNVIEFSVYNDAGIYSMGAIFEKIVEQSGRTANFSYATINGNDFYGTTTGVRNIHIITPGTKFSVYNAANTQELFSAEKINGVWTYTRA